MPRGRTKVYYQSDILTMFDSAGNPIGAQFVTELPDDTIAQAGLGWSASPPVPLGPTGVRLPRRLRPRHMVGVDNTGHRVRVWVAALTASDWGNAGATWTFVDNNGATQTATVTGFVGEATTV